MTIRITGGEFRGRQIKAPAHDRTRPTASQLRQALFNSIQTFFGQNAEVRVLDLFAGSGALGFEALSRGADECTFVEKDRRVAKLIEENAALLKCDERTDVKADDVLSFLARPHAAKWNLVLADPPYAHGFDGKLLEHDWSQTLAPEGLFFMEWSPLKSDAFRGRDGLPETVNGLRKIREKTYGDSCLTTYIFGSP